MQATETFGMWLILSYCHASADVCSTSLRCWMPWTSITLSAQVQSTKVMSGNLLMLSFEDSCHSKHRFGNWLLFKHNKTNKNCSNNIEIFHVWPRINLCKDDILTSIFATLLAEFSSPGTILRLRNGTSGSRNASRLCVHVIVWLVI